MWLSVLCAWISGNRLALRFRFWWGWSNVCWQTGRSRRVITVIIGDILWYQLYGCWWPVTIRHSVDVTDVRDSLTDFTTLALCSTVHCRMVWRWGDMFYTIIGNKFLEICTYQTGAIIRHALIRQIMLWKKATQLPNRGPWGKCMHRMHI